METNAAYYSRRAREESTSAANAPHPHARAVHLELARRYASLLTIERLLVPAEIVGETSGRARPG